MKLFTDKEIQDIYINEVKKPPSYFTKHKTVPHFSEIGWNNWNGKDFGRVYGSLDFKEWVLKHNINHGIHLGYTCKTDPEIKYVTYQKNTLLTYPEYDLHNLPEIEDKFDMFIFNQTIEHLYNPFMAIESIYKNIKNGGYVFTSVPTINIPHSTPFHYNGYNPMGLALLFKSAGFELIEIGQWGNYDYISKLFQTHDWPDYNYLQKNGNVTNEERNVCQCWILARKPL